ncbi:MAG: copper amine oxidase N-terminal domain-containing protein [Firmicutes bacterium]|nr:copper amine oxidase N-terminal domain-containing protein [Bacillota bacterium]
MALKIFKILVFLILSSFFLIPNTAAAEGTINVEWHKVYGTPDVLESGQCATQTSDGGYIIVGWKADFRVGFSNNIYLVKTDSSGNTIWEKTYSKHKPVDLYGNYLQQTSDGGYIVVGNISNSDFDSTDVYLFKIDHNGNMLWEKTFGSSFYDSGKMVQQTKDEGFIICGNSESVKFDTVTYGNSSLYVIKTNSEGVLEWESRFGSSPDKNPNGYSIVQTSDGGYIVVGTKSSKAAGEYDIHPCEISLNKIDSTGHRLWEKTFDGNTVVTGTSVQQTIDGGFIIAGSTGEGKHWIPSSALLIKTDANGNKLWENTYSDKLHADAHSVQQTDDGGYILAGSTRESTLLDKPCSAYIVRTDSDGNKMWEKTIDRGTYNYVSTIEITTDGGYILGGVSDWDLYLIKLKTQDPPIRVFINNKKVRFDTIPYIKDGRTMVPLRSIAEALGAKVNWDSGAQTITLTKEGMNVRLTISNPQAYINSDSVQLDAPAEIVDSRTFVPLRFIGEAFKAEVKWDNNIKAVQIKS